MSNMENDRRNVPVRTGFQKALQLIKKSFRLGFGRRNISSKCILLLPALGHLGGYGELWRRRA